MMKGWKKCELGDVITLSRGYDLPSQNRTDGVYPIVSSSGITGFHNQHKANAPGVVTGRYGTIGEVFYIKTDYWPLNTTLFVKDFKGNNPRYVSYLLNCLNFKEMNVAGAVPGVNKNHLHKIKVHLPPLPIQQKIASILSAYDDLIENNLKRIKLLEEMAQITYEEWFVRMRFPGYESVPIDSTTGLPEEWKTVKLRVVLQLNYGKALKAETRIKGDIPVYGSSGIVGTHKDALVEGCGIIIGRKGNVGSVFWSHDSFYPIDTVYFVTSTHTAHFLYYVLRNSKFDNSDAAVPGLNRDSAYSVEITLPSEAMERQFSERIKKNFSVIQSLEKQNQLLREARDILLPRLMTGIIDVDSYNPADLLKEVA